MQTMDWVSNMPMQRTAFEQFVLKYLGLNVDMSSSAIFGLAFVALLLVPLFMIGSGRSRRR